MGHYLYDIGIDLVELLILCNACINKRGAIGDHRIDSLPCGNLFLCAVGGSIAGGVSGITIGEHIQQHRSLTVLDKLLLALVGFNYCKRIVAVYALCMHLAGGNARAHSCKNIVSHGFAVGLSAHAVLVVENIEDDGQSAFVSLVPQLGVLIHRGEVHSLPNRAAAKGSIADICNDKAFLAVYSFVKSGTGGNTCAAAHYGVVGINAEGQEEGVHGAAQTLGEAGFAGKQLGYNAVEEEGARHFLNGLKFAVVFHNAKGGAVPGGLHDAHQLFVAELFNAGKPFCQNVGMGAVRTEDKIVFVKKISLTYRSRLLADAEVSGAGMTVMYAVVFAGGFDEVDHGLKLADNSHIVIDTQEILG